MRVYDLAHARTGDKGHSINISVIAYDGGGFAHLETHLTADKVMAAFDHIADGPVNRYILPKLGAFNFVIEKALGGGVTANLSQDLHGKSLGFLLLDIDLPDMD